MDCADVVMGQARGNRFRILDYYTRDRATPRLDSFYGGDDDITAAVGREVNGVTSIKFRRPLSTGRGLELDYCERSPVISLSLSLSL